MAKKQYWCVVYRTGGLANFKWHRTLAVWERSEAEQLKADVQRGGRLAYVVDYDQSVRIGLPETYCSTMTVGGDV